MDDTPPAQAPPAQVDTPQPRGWDAPREWIVNPSPTGPVRTEPSLN